ncbi:PAS domain-containing sensor histidine kinase [Dysgonomonas sp. 25]|uniref:sensor histidine kinase n=1 Tax=Dysgonomonas sp. 25 TaxID=2302933 RepID=UPI0013D08A0C|nr:ATP-binding protein [Dysgonomonas sp. 25]NDV67881.1 HAMP domain-containing protein [Dysgonomonas sp. 25]
MKSKILFWLLALIVFGALGFFGFQYFGIDMRMFFLFEGITILALILFVVLYRRLIRPYKIIADGMDLLKEQDFSTRLRPISDSEANKLISVFNRMMDSLKEERLQVREKNHFLDLLIHASPQGVIILDFDEYITDINPSGLKLLKITDKNILLGEKIKDTPISIAHSLAELKPGDDIVLRGTGVTAYRCTRSSFIDKGFNHPFILIEELTDELLRIEKKSYEGVIRMMAHEVNNSVGAISSTLNVISDILKEREKDDFSYVLPAVDASFNRCLHLGRFVSNFAEVVKLPEPHKTQVNLNELVKSVEALTNIECQRRDIRLTMELSSEQCLACIDAIQFEQILVNIIKNAYEAIEQDGEIRIITATNPLSIAIWNNGPAISDEVAKNLFIPFFSTKPSGQGVGLMIVREILRNHNTNFKFYSENEWTKFEIDFSL